MLQAQPIVVWTAATTAAVTRYGRFSTWSHETRLFLTALALASVLYCAHCRPPIEKPAYSHWLLVCFLVSTHKQRLTGKYSLLKRERTQVGKRLLFGWLYAVNHSNWQIRYIYIVPFVAKSEPRFKQKLNRGFCVFNAEQKGERMDNTTWVVLVIIAGLLFVSAMRKWCPQCWRLTVKKHVERKGKQKYIEKRCWRCGWAAGWRRG